MCALVIMVSWLRRRSSIRKVRNDEGGGDEDKNVGNKDGEEETVWRKPESGAAPETRFSLH